MPETVFLMAAALMALTELMVRSVPVPGRSEVRMRPCPDHEPEYVEEADPGNAQGSEETEPVDAEADDGQDAGDE